MNHSAAPQRAAVPGTLPALDLAGDIDSTCLLRALEAFATREALITERFYETFFARRPDTLELFGVHSISEREEMIRETLRSLHALYEGNDWLEENLIALGTSHYEYGVTGDMYPSFVDCLVECGREVLGHEIDAPALNALRAATMLIAEQMSAAGEDASARRNQKVST
jgi:hemoglobin-like flavoprotein